MCVTLSLCLAGALASASLACGERTTAHADSTIVPASYKPTADIVETAVGAGQFKTLASALQAADLVDTLKSEGPFTVFAPTDEAFAALPPGTIETLLKPENHEKLVAILTYHVVLGRVYADDVAKLDAATTVQGASAPIEKKGGAILTDGARVTSPDIEASNGVIHVIDKVLIPN